MVSADTDFAGMQLIQNDKIISFSKSMHDAALGRCKKAK
jgi:hypothetical protein